MTQTAQGRAVYTTFIRNVSRPYLQNWRILSVKRMNHFWLAAGLAASQFLSQTANAGIEISVQPDPLAVAGSNTPFSVDTWVSGLNGAGTGGSNEVIQGYNFLLGYDATLVTATGVAFGPWLEGPTNSSQYSNLDVDPSDLGIYTGTFDNAVELYEVSYLTATELDTSQGDSFRLVTVSFAVNNLPSGKYHTTLGLIDDRFFTDIPAIGLDFKGSDPINPLVVSLDDGALTISEPNSLALLLTAGLVAIGRTLASRGRRSILRQA